MKARRFLLVAAVLSGLTPYAGADLAQALDAQLFSPAVDPQGYFSVYSSRTAPAGRFHVALWYNWANDPLFLTEFDGEDLGGATRVVDDLHTFDLVGSYSILDWLEVGLDVPLSDVASDLGEDEVRQSAGFDDIRLLSKLQLVDNAKSPVGAAVVPFVDLPVGEEERLTANDETDFGVLAVVDHVHQRFHVALNVGYKANGGGENNELLFGLGAGVLAIHNQPILGGFFDNLEVLAEAYGASDEDDLFDEFATPIEVLGGVRLFSPNGLYLTTGIGQAVTDSFNAAKVRVVASVGYTPPPPPPPPPPAPVAAPAPPPPPPQPQVVVTDEQIVTLAPIYFEFDRDAIKPVSYPVLDQVVEVMKQRPTAVVRVEGHTDSFGSDAYNQKLSERRAHSVVRYMISKGVESERLQAVGYGEARPIATNDTAEGRAKNRRTEFHIIREVR